MKNVMFLAGGLLYSMDRWNALDDLTSIWWFAEMIWMVQIVPPIEQFELHRIDLQIDFQMISEK